MFPTYWYTFQLTPLLLITNTPITIEFWKMSSKDRNFHWDVLIILSKVNWCLICDHTRYDVHLKQKAEKETEKIQRKAEHREKKTRAQLLEHIWSNHGTGDCQPGMQPMLIILKKSFLKLFLQAWILKSIAN